MCQNQRQQVDQVGGDCQRQGGRVGGDQMSMRMLRRWGPSVNKKVEALGAGDNKEIEVLGEERRGG